MVLKVSKHGVRSGNSIKSRKYSGHHRHYSKQALIVRDLVLSGDKIDQENILGDFDIRSSRIPYSMNKKGRWELPDMIKSRIEDGDFDDKKFAVQLIEHHKLLGRESCISIHSSKSPKSWKEGERCRTNKVGYLNSDSVLAPKNDILTIRERRHRLRRGIPLQEEPVAVPSSVRYQVCYPPSPTSYLSFMPKYTGYSSSYKERNAVNCSFARHGNRCIRRPKYGKRFHEEMLEEMTYEFNEDFRNDNVSHSDFDETYTSNIETEVLLEDVIRNNRVKKQRLRKRRLSSGSCYMSNASVKDSHIIYEQVQSLTNVKPKEIATTDFETKAVQSVMVSLPSQEVDCNSLELTYGNMYTECDCYPRKFIIDITDRIRVKEGEPLTCVVFTLNKGNNYITDSIYEVRLNTTGFKNLHNQKVETLFDYMETTVEECLQRTAVYIEALPEFTMDKDVLTTIRKTKKSHASNVEKCANWESNSYVPNQTFFYSMYLSSCKKGAELNKLDFDTKRHAECTHADNLKAMSSFEEKVCDICYERLGEIIPGTALTSCGHWFCDSCWTEYLEGRVRTGAASLTCPEYDCDNVVSPATVITLLSLRDVIRHAQCCHDNTIECGVDTKWCPNVKCGRVLRVNSASVKSARCNCGEVFCFDCRGQIHWPATCDAFTKYFKRLEETGDIGLAPFASLESVIVNGKNCPHCNKFLEKNGGCPFMGCVCGGNFCWGCGKDWNSNTHDNSCYTHGYKDEHNTYEVNLEDDRLKRNNKKVKWYNIAVKHRAEQHLFKVEQMKSAKKTLLPFLSSYISRSAKRGIIVSLEFDGLKSTYRKEQEKLPEYLNEMILLHQELNHLIEHTAVMMDLDDIPSNKALRVQYQTNRLASFVDGISSGFSHGLHKKPEDLLALFKKIRVHSYRTIKCLFTLVNKR